MYIKIIKINLIIKKLILYTLAGDVKDNDTDDNSTPNPTPAPVPSHDIRPASDVKSVPNRIAPPTYSSWTADYVYTLYRASDMKLICYNVVNLKALIDLFKFNLTNGHLKVYIDSTLLFDCYVGDDLSQVIFEIIEKYLGKHKMTIEFTGSDGKT